jgi:hypothetical protein
MIVVAVFQRQAITAGRRAKAKIKMRNLSKSKLLAFRQCPKRLWLEVHRPEPREETATTQATFRVGHTVGETARRLYDPSGSGTVINAQTEGVAQALALTTVLLNSSAPIFEAGFAVEGAVVFADVMLPIGEGPSRSWRMVEVKSSTSVDDHHRDDIAIQAFVAMAAGISLDSIAMAHIDSEWIYPGEENYQGLLIESDLADETFAVKRFEIGSRWLTALCRIGSSRRFAQALIGTVHAHAEEKVVTSGLGGLVLGDRRRIGRRRARG